jgi:hypothetical protein
MRTRWDLRFSQRQVRIWLSSVMCRVVWQKLNDGLMMETASTSETSVIFYQTTRHNVPKRSRLRRGQPSIFSFRNLFSRLSVQMRACKSRDCLLSTMQGDRTRFRVSQIKKANKTRWHYESLICDWKYTSRSNGITPAFAPEVHIDAKLHMFSSETLVCIVRWRTSCLVSCLYEKDHTSVTERESNTATHSDVPLDQATKILVFQNGWWLRSNSHWLKIILYYIISYDISRISCIISHIL